MTDDIRSWKMLLSQFSEGSCEVSQGIHDKPCMGVPTNKIFNPTTQIKAENPKYQKGSIRPRSLETNRFVALGIPCYPNSFRPLVLSDLQYANFEGIR